MRPGSVPVVVIGICLATASSPTQGQNGDWKKNLDTTLKKAMTLTSVGAGGQRLTKIGSTLTVLVPGISAGLSTDKGHLINHSTPDGEIRQARGIFAALANKETNRDFKPGEKVYLTDLDIDDEKIDIVIISDETFPVTVNGSTKQTRYQAYLRIDFPKGYLASASPEQVLTQLGHVIKLEAAPGQPQTIALGQTPEEVEAILGKPDKIVNLGAKVLWIYKDLKVTFTDGKVSDVS